MAIQDEARKASYERAVEQATQNVINWSTNSESWANYMKTRARWSQASPKNMRLAFYGLMGRGISTMYSRFERATFNSADYDARRSQIADWHYEATTKGQRSPDWTYANEDSHGAAKDMLDTGIWLADDGDNVTANTLLDALMLALGAVDWEHVLVFFRDDYER